MRWIPLVLVLAATAAFAPVAGAATPCRQQVYNDWEKDGKIASTYPLSCYRDALRHIPAGDSVYTSLEDDIRSALQAAVLRSHGRKVAAQVGHGFPKPGSSVANPMMDERTHPLPSSPTTVASQAVNGSSDGGVPLPLLVLGGFALLLIASGGVGLALRATRGGARGA
jgi:hypothetical protein